MPGRNGSDRPLNRPSWLRQRMVGAPGIIRQRGYIRSPRVPIDTDQCHISVAPWLAPRKQQACVSIVGYCAACARKRNVDFLEIRLRVRKRPPIEPRHSLTKFGERLILNVLAARD